MIEEDNPAVLSGLSFVGYFGRNRRGKQIYRKMVDSCCRTRINIKYHSSASAIDARVGEVSSSPGAEQRLQGKPQGSLKYNQRYSKTHGIVPNEQDPPTSGEKSGGNSDRQSFDDSSEDENSENMANNNGSDDKNNEDDNRRKKAGGDTDPTDADEEDSDPNGQDDDEESNPVSEAQNDPTDKIKSINCLTEVQKDLIAEAMTNADATNGISEGCSQRSEKPREMLSPDEVQRVNNFISDPHGYMVSEVRFPHSVSQTDMQEENAGSSDAEDPISRTDETFQSNVEENLEQDDSVLNQIATENEANLEKASNLYLCESKEENVAETEEKNSSLKPSSPHLISEAEATPNSPEKTKQISPGRKRKQSKHKSEPTDEPITQLRLPPLRIALRPFKKPGKKTENKRVVVSQAPPEGRRPQYHRRCKPSVIIDGEDSPDECVILDVAKKPPPTPPLKPGQKRKYGSSKGYLEKKMKTPEKSSADDIEVIEEKIVNRTPQKFQRRDHQLQNKPQDENVSLLEKLKKSVGSALSITIKKKKVIPPETQLALEQLKKMSEISTTRIPRKEAATSVTINSLTPETTKSQSSPTGMDLPVITSVVSCNNENGYFYNVPRGPTVKKQAQWSKSPSQSSRKHSSKAIPYVVLD